MKTLCCDYLVPHKPSKEGDWWGVVSISNHALSDGLAFVRILSYESGLSMKSMFVKIPAMGSVLLTNNEISLSGRVRVYVQCDDKITAQAGNSRGFNNISWQTLEILRFDPPVKTDELPVILGASPVYYYVGNCPFVRKDVLDCIEVSAFKIHERFPDRVDRRLWVGDASPSRGNCPGHPANSHDGKNQIDFNYYTFASNATQYHKGEALTQMWHDGRLLTDVFDWERSFALMEYIQEMFPKTHFIIQEDILRHIKSKTNIPFIGNISADPGTVRNHHTHIHCEIRR